MLTCCRRSFAARMTCLLASVLTVIVCIVMGLNIWHTWRHLEHEMLSDLNNRLQLIASINNNEFLQVVSNARKLLTLRSSINMMESRLAGSWSPLPEKSPPAENGGRTVPVGLSMTTAPFFYFPENGRLFSVTQTVSPDFNSERTAYLRKLIRLEDNKHKEIIRDYPVHTARTGVTLITVAAVSRRQDGSVDAIAGYELFFHKQKTRMAALLKDYNSFLVDRNGVIVSVVSGYAPSSEYVKIPSLNHIKTFPHRITLNDGTSAMAVWLDATELYLVSLIPPDRKNKKMQHRLYHEILFFSILAGIMAAGFMYVTYRLLSSPLSLFFRLINDGTQDVNLHDHYRVLFSAEDELGRAVSTCKHLKKTIFKEREVAEYKIAQRTMALHKKLNATEQMNTLKSQFIANVSHEIRNPLNIIIGMSHLLDDSSLTTHQKRFSSSIRDNCNALLVLLNDVLDLSKIEAGHLNIESSTFDLIKQIDSVIKVVENSATKKNLQLFMHISSCVPDRVTGDPWRLRQILLNLLGNAIKFTHSGYVRLLVWKGDNADIGFHIIDSGTGIPADKLEAIFDVYQQADASTTREYGGCGLGLSISRRLAQLMGGNINVESQYGVGSVFTLQLPLPANPGHEQQGHEEITYTFSHDYQLNVLIIDDSVSNRELMCLYLEKMGHRYCCAGNGQEALQLMNKTIFDAVLLDSQMPVMDGLETLTRLRAGRHHVLDEDIWVIALTADAMTTDRDEFLKRGANTFLAKPVLPDQLFNALQDAITWQAERGVELVSMPSTHSETCDILTQTEQSSLFQLYMEDTRQILSLMQESVRSADKEMLAGYAHKLKGSAGQFNDPVVEHLASSLEDNAKLGREDLIESDLHALEEYVGRLSEKPDGCL